ncbi:hypothetical protein QC763_0092440 [Podospora pseudopauciseta]|uniref:Uncharacterized protein n=1 Tax=Podospora pseudopauciseta TaxID=2093780 RepID=A0ABR0H4B2_9PEZI|nr:hypothetical protein QC763_0092440 [Podospora pseudopauciseta]
MTITNPLPSPPASPQKQRDSKTSSTASRTRHHEDKTPKDLSPSSSRNMSSKEVIRSRRHVLVKTAHSAKDLPKQPAGVYGRRSYFGSVDQKSEQLLAAKGKAKEYARQVVPTPSTQKPKTTPSDQEHKNSR